jgi:hypothetical protein
VSFIFCFLKNVFINASERWTFQSVLKDGKFKLRYDCKSNETLVNIRIMIYFSLFSFDIRFYWMYTSYIVYVGLFFSFNFFVSFFYFALFVHNLGYMINL